MRLRDNGDEQVFMWRIASGREQRFEENPGGMELFVVRGTVRFHDQTLPAESWLRLPAKQAATIRALSDSVLWVKSGHLPANGVADP